MPFWSTNFGEDKTLNDPKRKFRFIVSFNGIQAAQGGALLWYAKTAAKPSFKVETTEHTYLNHKFHYPGSITWEEISITLVDPVDPDMTATFSDIITQAGYSPPANANALSTISKAKAATALGTVTISQLDSMGAELETWTLWNAFITEVKYGDLEYGSEDIIEMTIGLRYDWARVETAKPSVAVAGAGGTEFFGLTES
tara:strand:- start:208 stop:804 length:597 start_codon:yes stop_codon:yes gene_type:complete